MYTVASILGPEVVAFLSNDDKARLNIGVTAVQRQTKITMHLEYRVKMADHDWIVADRCVSRFLYNGRVLFATIKTPFSTGKLFWLGLQRTTRLHQLLLPPKWLCAGLLSYSRVQYCVFLLPFNSLTCNARCCLKKTPLPVLVWCMSFQNTLWLRCFCCAAALICSHKLIPSVYAVCGIENGRMGDPAAVLSTGPTFVRIRSGKHDASTAFTHANDVQELFKHALAKPFVCDKNGEAKPVLMFSVDGGPDESPRNSKVGTGALVRVL